MLLCSIKMITECSNDENAGDIYKSQSKQFSSLDILFDINFCTVSSSVLGFPQDSYVPARDAFSLYQAWERINSQSIHCLIKTIWLHRRKTILYESYVQWSTSCVWHWCLVYILAQQPYTIIQGLCGPRPLNCLTCPPSSKTCPPKRVNVIFDIFATKNA